MGFWSALGGAAGSVVSSLADTVLNSYYNKKAASKQNEYQWSFWQANNDYNSPKSQMQRLEEAGLNPNLVYGNGGATHQATMATAPKVSPAQSNLLGAIEAFYQMRNTESQTELADANVVSVQSATKNARDITKATLKKNELERQALQHNLEVARRDHTPVGTMTKGSAFTAFGEYLGDVAFAVDQFIRKKFGRSR